MDIEEEESLAGGKINEGLKLADNEEIRAVSRVTTADASVSKDSKDNDIESIEHTLKDWG